MNYEEMLQLSYANALISYNKKRQELENFKEEIKNLDFERKEELNNFFDRSYLEVLNKLLVTYSYWASGLRRGNDSSFLILKNIGVEALASKGRLSYNEQKYLAFRYYDKMMENHFSNLGVIGTDVKSGEYYSKYYDYIDFDCDDNTYSKIYVLKTTFYFDSFSNNMRNDSK